MISSVPAVKMRGHDPSTVSGAGVGAVGVMTPSDCVAVKADEPLLGTHAPSDVRTMRESKMFMKCTSARMGWSLKKFNRSVRGKAYRTSQAVATGLTANNPRITAENAVLSEAA